MIYATDNIKVFDAKSINEILLKETKIMAYTQPKEVKMKENQDKFLRPQLEKEREQ